MKLSGVLSDLPVSIQPFEICTGIKHDIAHAARSCEIVIRLNIRHIRQIMLITAGLLSLPSLI